jgi:hypothetical protein
LDYEANARSGSVDKFPVVASGSYCSLAQMNSPSMVQ